LLVYTIIEAPRRGWSDPLTIWSFAAVAILVASFVAIERRRRQPMIHVSLFRTPAF